MAQRLPSDQDTPYNQLSQAEQDLPHNVFLQRDEFARLRRHVIRLERRPIPFDTLQDYFVQNFDLYRDLYDRLPDLKDPFCTKGFERILALARQRGVDAGPLYIILIVLACLKKAPDDQLPLDPTAPGVTAQMIRRDAALMENLFGLLVATIETLCPCYGPAADGRAARRGVGRQSEPSQPLYEICKLFTRAIVACLKRDNIYLDHAYAYGSWATALTEVREKYGAIDLGTFPQHSPILNCRVYSNYHPRAITIDLLTFPRTIHIALVALAHWNELQRSPQLPHRRQGVTATFRGIFDLIVHAIRDASFPIGGLNWLLQEIGKTENDPVQELLEALLAARNTFQEDFGLYRTIVTGGEMCSSESVSESSSTGAEQLTIKQKHFAIYEAGGDPTSLTVKEVVEQTYQAVDRKQLVERYGMALDVVASLSDSEVCSQIWLRRNKSYLERQTIVNIDVSKMDNTQIFSVTQEVSARLELAAKGVPNVEAMSPAQALKAVHPLRVATYLASAGVETAGMSNYELKSAYFKESKMIPQMKRLIALLENDDHFATPIPNPASNVSDRHHDIDPTIPITSFVNEQTANQFFETINQGNAIAKKSNQPEQMYFADLLAAFPPSSIFRFVQYFPRNQQTGKVTRSPSAATFGEMIDRAIGWKWYEEKESLGWFKQNGRQDSTARSGGPLTVYNAYQGWGKALKAFGVEIRFSRNIPDHLRQQILEGIEISNWLRDGMPCSKNGYKGYNVVELKWLALFFCSSFWYFEKV